MRTPCLFLALGAAACAPDAQPDTPLSVSTDSAPPEPGAAPDAGAPIGLATSPMGRSGPSSGDSGSMRMEMQDAPIELDAMPVTIEAVYARRASQRLLFHTWEPVVSDATSWDLLTLTGGVTGTLGERELPVGDYDQLLVVVDDVSIDVAGDLVALDLPASLLAGVPVDVEFTVEADHDYELLIDFDAQQSVTETPLGYALDPHIEVVHVIDLTADTGR